MKLIFGDGMIRAQQGTTTNGNKCLTLTKMQDSKPVGSVPLVWNSTIPESEIDVILEFKSLESARTLQDELNELVAVWSKQIAQRV